MPPYARATSCDTVDLFVEGVFEITSVLSVDWQVLKTPHNKIFSGIRDRPALVLQLLFANVVRLTFVFSITSLSTAQFWLGDSIAVKSVSDRDPHRFLLNFFVWYLKPNVSVLNHLNVRLYHWSAMLSYHYPQTNILMCWCVTWRPPLYLQKLSTNNNLGRVGHFPPGYIRGSNMLNGLK